MSVCEFNQCSPFNRNPDTQMTLIYNNTNTVNTNKSIITYNNTSLEAIFKRQDYTNDITIKLNFIKKKSGEDQLINVLRFLDKNVNMISEKEAIDKIISIVGEKIFSSIHQTLSRVLKSIEYKFKN